MRLEVLLALALGCVVLLVSSTTGLHVGVVTLGTQGHVRPMMCVVEELLAREHEVTLFSSVEGVALAEGLLSEISRYGDVEMVTSVVPRVPEVGGYQWLPQALQARQQLLALSSYMEEGIADYVKDKGLDVLLVDFLTFAGMEVADRNSLPSAVLMPSFSVNGSMGAVSIAPLPFLFGEPLPRTYYRNKQIVVAAPSGQDLQRLERFAGDSIVQTPPLIWEPPATEESAMSAHLTSWLAREDSRPLVYVSFGTMIMLTPQQVVTLAEAFTQLKGDYRVLWQLEVAERYGVVGWDKNLRYPASPSLFVADMVPQRELLAHARGPQYFLTHAGTNSIHEAVEAGVPLMFAPQAMDQCDNAGLALDLGLGTSLCGCGEKMYVEDIVVAFSWAAGNRTEVVASMASVREEQLDSKRAAAIAVDAVEKAAAAGFVSLPTPAGKASALMDSGSAPTLLLSASAVIVVPALLAMWKKSQK